MIGAIVLPPTDAARQEAVVSSAEGVVVVRARALRDAAVQYCLEYLARLLASKCYQEVVSLQPMTPPKRFDIFPSDWGMLRKSRCVQIFL